ncbi:MAG: hypothetical protein JWM19_1093 [Actinomycetia bacterium]|nr:hypothetical protein [Actinomycetes bacterium]
MPQVAAPVSRATSSGAGPGRGPAGRASTGRPSSDTGPLPGSRSGRRKKGLFRRTGIIFPAICIAVVIVAIVAVASYRMSPNGSGASGLAPVFDTLTHSKSVGLLEAERQQLIDMNAAAGTLSDAAKPSKVSPSAVMASAAAATNAAQNNAANTGSSNSGSQQVVQAAAPDTGTAQQIGYDMLPSFGYNQSSEWTCLQALWNQESGWRYDAENPSGAYGIPQSLPGDKMASAGADWQTDPTTQIRWGLGYIQSVYGTPCGAWDHEVADGWY